MSSAIVRVDLFQTVRGMEEMSCACDGQRSCLYHWYYEVKMSGAPTPPKQEEKISEQFPGRKPKRTTGTRSGKQHRTVPEPGVRQDGAGDRDRPGKPVRGQEWRG